MTSGTDERYWEEFSCLTVENILELKPEKIAAERWLSMLLASYVTSSSSLEKRIKVILKLAKLHEKDQYFHIEHCSDREDIVNALLDSGNWIELLSLLKTSLVKWVPGGSSTDDMFWLIKVLLRAIEQCHGKTSCIIFKSGTDSLSFNSKVMIEIETGEAVSAAAEAWVRCLKSPGGDNICAENTWVFEDHGLGLEILESLARDPVAFVSIIHESESKNITFELETELILKYMARGIIASEYSLRSLLKESVPLAVKNQLFSEAFFNALEGSRERILDITGYILKNLYSNEIKQLKESEL